MSEQRKGRDGLMECLSGHDMELVNIKFFRGNRDDVITAEEICAEAHSAIMQRRMGTATVTREAPKSTKPPMDVQEFAAQL